MTIETLSIVLVLLAAVMHASWNALVKSSSNSLLTIGAVIAVGGILAIPLLFILPFPAPESWNFLLGSVVVHVLYYLALDRSYAWGDLSFAYPIARGIAPALVAVGGVLWAGEVLTTESSIGVALISLGILSLVHAPHLAKEKLQKGIGFSLLTGITIAAYSIIDGIGGRLAGNVFSYIAWLYVLNMFATLTIIAVFYRNNMRTFAISSWKRLITGGLLATFAYGIVIWAMTLNQLAQISALRETSVLFAAIIGSTLLREDFAKRRILSAAIVLIGVILLATGKS